jgi:nuclease S1
MGRRCVHSGARAKPTSAFRSNARSLPRKAGCARRVLCLFAAASAAALLMIPTRAALAWGRLAHRASAKLADSRLSPRTRALIRELLEPGESLADASTWADEHSRDIPGSMSWHFVNVPIWAPHYDPRDCRPQGCVVSKIADFKATLKDRNTPVARRRTALRFLVHLVQDVHQPMHVADRNDRGGNSLQLRYGRYDHTNLHQVWDSGLLSRAFRNEDDLMRHLEALAGRPEARDWLKGRTENWADESLLVGRLAYHIPGSEATLRSGDSIGREYERENVPKATDRLARSAVRLAAVLEEVFKDSEPRTNPIRGIRTQGKATVPAGK